jgi:hypothetical protein
VESTGKASFGTNPVEVSASSTWQLSGAQIGEKLGFTATGAVANEGELTTAYYVNNLTRSQTQGGITNTYNLDAALHQRERITSGGSEAGTEIYHYSGSSDSPAWTDGGGSKWSRSIAALGVSLGAIQTSSGKVTLQLAGMAGLDGPPYSAPIWSDPDGRAQLCSSAWPVPQPRSSQGRFR